MVGTIMLHIVAVGRKYNFVTHVHELKVCIGLLRGPSSALLAGKKGFRLFSRFPKKNVTEDEKHEDNL